MIDGVRAVLNGSPPPATAPKPPTLDLSHSALRLLCASLRVGAIRALVRSGGFLHRPYIHSDGTRRFGPLWAQHPGLELRFSPASLALSQWLSGANPSLYPATAGDELLYYLAARALAPTSRPLQPLAGSRLVLLAFPDRVEGQVSSREWADFIRGPGAALLEGLGLDLTRRLVEVEVGKGRIPRSERLIRVSERQSGCLQTLGEAATAAQRHELLTFVVDAGHRLRRRPPQAWIRSLDPSESMRARAEACQAAAGLLAFMVELEKAYETLAAVPFFDDDYPRAQVVLERWRTLGRGGFAALRATAEELQSARPLLKEAPHEPRVPN